MECANRSDSVNRANNRCGEVRYGEGTIAFVLLAITFFLRIAYIFNYRFSTDEPQHLHIIWGWANGLLQYRDVFDNHTPLFHLLYTPVFLALGEYPGVLFKMRLAMIPLYILALLSTYIISREIFSQRIGLWATVFLGLFPWFFLCSVEFRADTLWTALWLLSVAFLVRGNMTAWRSFIVGFLLGITLGVSMKTILLLLSIGISALATVIFSARNFLQKPNFLRLSFYTAAMLLGFLIIPLLLVLFFYEKGALTPFFYGTVKHNIISGYGHWKIFQWRFLLFPMILIFLWRGARIIVFLGGSSRRILTRRVFVFFVLGVYVSVLEIFWPIIEWQTRLPFFPLLVIFLTPLILIDMPGWIVNWFRGARLQRLLSGSLVPVFVVFLGIWWLTNLLFVNETSWRNNIHKQIGLLTDVLWLTNSKEPVFDLKGETIFRKRSFYYALEHITRKRIKLGLINDDISEHLIATRTCVAIPDNPQIPLRTKNFLNENYLLIGHLRVVGQFLNPSESNEMYSIFFDVRVPVRYAILSRSGMVKGWLDGTPYNGARFLATGHHEFRPSSTGDKFAFVWAQAVERGFSPFLTAKRNHDKAV